jgi:hypothetical protein
LCLIYDTKEGKKEIDEILMDTSERYKRGEIKEIPLDSFKKMQGDRMDKILKVANKRELVQIVPSKWMNKYLRDKKEFTDREMATLIWNAPNTTLNNRLASLEVLERRTSDEILKEQIMDRVSYEKKAYMLFCTIDKGYVYVLCDEKGDDCGFFANAALAEQIGIRNAKEWKEKYFRVEKQRIFSGENGSQIYRVWDDSYTSDVRYDSDGDILEIYSKEMSDEDNERVDKKRERFEYQFFEIPFAMEAGSIVKILDQYDYGEYAVLDHGEDEWNKYMEKMARINKTGGVDFSDIQIVVWTLGTDGIWRHRHVNPLYLEKEIPEIKEEYINSQAYYDAMCAMSEYIKNPTKENNQNALRATKVYAEVCGSEKCRGEYDVENLFDGDFGRD